MFVSYGSRAFVLLSKYSVKNTVTVIHIFHHYATTRKFTYQNNFSCKDTIADPKLPMLV